MIDERYIKTGYEESLIDILEDPEIKTILVNGKFGSGKTAILNYALENLEERKVKKLKIYDEYIEENYIDYLYNTFKNDECKLFRFIKDNLIFLGIAAVSSVILILTLVFKWSITNSLTNSTGNNPESDMIFVFVILFIVYILFDFIKRTLKQSKVNKIEYIKNSMNTIDFLVIDDLDRIYIKNNEILKMIHFLEENMSGGTNLILLGDKSNFNEELDILEKYYDFSFEVPQDLVSVKMVESLEKFILEEFNIDYGDDINAVLDILKKLTPRQVKKVYAHLRLVLSDTDMKTIISKLFRSDYIFMVTIYYCNDIEMNKIYEMLYDLKSLIESQRYGKAFPEKELHTKANEKINGYVFNEGIKDYLLDGFKYCLGSREEFSGSYYYKNGPRYDWRFFNNYVPYKINSYISSKEPLNDILNSFVYDLEHNFEKANLTMSVKEEHTPPEEFKSILLDRIKKVDDWHSQTLFRKLYYLKQLEEHDNLNLKYYNLTYDDSILNLSDEEVFNNLNSTIKDDWEELHYVNILNYLARECYTKQKKREKRDVVLEWDDTKKIELVSKMVDRTAMAMKFWDIFEDKLKDLEGIDIYIDEILKILEKNKLSARSLIEEDKEIIKIIENINKHYKKDS